MGIGVILGIAVFRLSLSMGWHWALAIFLAAIPIAGTFFLGIIGLLASAVFVGALYKATAG